MIPKPPEQAQRRGATGDSKGQPEATEELKFPLISATAVQTFMQEHVQPVIKEQLASGKPEAEEIVPEGVRLC